MDNFNSVKKSVADFFRRPFWTDYRTLFGLWMLIGFVSVLTKIGKWNNFLIFRGVFWHTLNGTSLYADYPEEYRDINHYGPFFSIVVAPFALPPTFLGCMFWNMALVLCLWIAVRKMQLDKWQHIFTFWFCAHELLTALFMQQFNIAICAIIVGTFVFIEKGKDHWATLLILIGTFVKLYGIVGICFFLFSKHKWRFTWTFFAWAAVLFVLPMAISSPDYVIGQYREWYDNLVAKNETNMFNEGINISMLGLVHKLSTLFFDREAALSFSDLWLIIPGCILFALPYLRFNQWKNRDFRLMFLASSLMFAVLFSTGTESSGYIIAFVGVCIWYCCVPWKRGNWDIALLVFVFIISSMSPSDLFPRYIRKEFIVPYSLKALPVAVVWLKLIYEMLVKEYSLQSNKA